jgi:Helix-turn-helix domain
MKTLCGECGRREVEPRTAAGRMSPYKNFPALPVPDDLAIPTCRHCGAEWIGARDAELIDAALEKAAADVLSRLAREALESMIDGVTQRDLEQRLGLSPGYISKVKRGHEVPSPALVSALTLLAVRPARLRELELVWSTLRLPPRLTTEQLSTWEGSAQGKVAV